MILITPALSAQNDSECAGPNCTAAGVKKTLADPEPVTHRNSDRVSAALSKADSLCSKRQTPRGVQVQLRLRRSDHFAKPESAASFQPRLYVSCMDTFMP
jgi:hypothetical protein